MYVQAVAFRCESGLYEVGGIPWLAEGPLAFKHVPLHQVVKYILF